jgi:hypothetical protein
VKKLRNADPLVAGGTIIFYRVSYNAIPDAPATDPWKAPSLRRPISRQARTNLIVGCPLMALYTPIRLISLGTRKKVGQSDGDSAGVVVSHACRWFARGNVPLRLPPVGADDAHHSTC